MRLIVFSILALASAALNILADYKKQRVLVYLFKPLTMLFIIALPLIGTAAWTNYKYLILAGLGCSLLGDIFLMLPKRRFIQGLVSFLIAHLFYSAAFLLTMRWRFSIWPVFPLLLYALIFFMDLFPYLGKMKLPVFAYMLVITGMACLASERHLQIKEMKTLLASIGAFLFIISDSSLAVNQFIRGHKFGQALTLGTYFTAQWLIAFSI